MKKFSATRMALLSRKKQIGLAQQGRDLLEQKRTALMDELLRTANSVLREAETLDATAADAMRSLARAEALAGSEAVRAAAFAGRSEFRLNVQTTSIMGVDVPMIEQKAVVRSMLGRGYAITGTSSAIDEAAQAFEAVVESIISLAERELRLMRLAAELQQTSRRLNALDHVLIPCLQDECAQIEQALAERERSDHYRLKLAKRKIIERPS